MEHDNDWDDLCTICQVSVHLICTFGWRWLYLLQVDSGQSISVELISILVNRKPTYICEGESAIKILVEETNPGICICNVIIREITR